MGRLAEPSGSTRLTRFQAEEFAEESNKRRDRGGWTTRRWRVIDDPKKEKPYLLIEVDASPKKELWKPSEEELRAEKDRIAAFCRANPQMSCADFNEEIRRGLFRAPAITIREAR